jgi:predicted nucleotidyltransferase
MTTSSLDLSDRADLRVLAELVSAIHEVKPDARFLLVGAMARDLLLTYAHGIQVQRATEDIDFAFAVHDWRAYEELRAALIASGGFEQMPQMVHRLLFAGQRKVDLIPFGGVEDRDGAIDWPPPQDTRMVVLGFQEAMASAVQVKLPDGTAVSVASLPAQAVLKLFAWGDRRHVQRGKDAGDLWLLLRNYLEAGNRERLYLEAMHLIEAEDYDDDLAGAWLLGADARQLLTVDGDAGKSALAGALALLAGEAEGPVRLATDMHPVDLELAVDTLLAFRAGLSGAATP